ncbi:hypothetical protein Dda3937_00059 [Dickeya dadantii 3937]|uniref:Uncharacterized protein n=1 Tax=Dickeya dadantii (strain 3937) TaxID=198628 RepID=E0SM74_DICD3|nr:hypothetical protein Dda3937_00059 [Dickeya dadantii 3937]
MSHSFLQYYGYFINKNDITLFSKLENKINDIHIRLIFETAVYFSRPFYFLFYSKLDTFRKYPLLFISLN